MISTDTNELKILPQINEAGTPAAPPIIDIHRLFQDHHVHLLRFVRRYLRNSEDAEDVVQATFIEALKCADRFAGLSKPSTWLFGIALNLARNQVRRNCNDMFETVDDTFMDQIPDKNSDPASMVEMRQIAIRVDSILKDLPPKFRKTFEAVLDGEASYEEAANQLQIPIGTIRSRVSRVRASVRAQLG